MCSLLPLLPASFDGQQQAICCLSDLNCMQLSTTEALKGLVAPASAYVLLGQAGPILIIIICFMVRAHDCDRHGRPATAPAPATGPCAVFEVFKILDQNQRKLDAKYALCGVRRVLDYCQQQLLPNVLEDIMTLVRAAGSHFQWRK